MSFGHALTALRKTNIDQNNSKQLTSRSHLHQSSKPPTNPAKLANRHHPNQPRNQTHQLNPKLSALGLPLVGSRRGMPRTQTAPEKKTKRSSSAFSGAGSEPLLKERAVKGHHRERPLTLRVLALYKFIQAMDITSRMGYLEQLAGPSRSSLNQHPTKDHQSC